MRNLFSELQRRNAILPSEKPIQIARIDISHLNGDLYALSQTWRKPFLLALLLRADGTLYGRDVVGERRILDLLLTSCD